MPSPAADRATLVVRALILAAAALTVTFVQERSAQFSLGVFAAFAFATAALFVVQALVSRRSTGPTTLLAAIHLVAGILALALPTAGDARFHWIVVGWALVAGAAELAAGIASRRRRPAARDGIAVGALTLLLAIVSFVISPEYALDYFVDDAERWFTLTGTIIGVGLFGGWAAIVAVYLGIGALSPAPTALTKDPV